MHTHIELTLVLLLNESRFFKKLNVAQPISVLCLRSDTFLKVDTSDSHPHQYLFCHLKTNIA